jgi:hypothetical protein
LNMTHCVVAHQGVVFDDNDALRPLRGLLEGEKERSTAALGEGGASRRVSS